MRHTLRKPSLFALLGGRSVIDASLGDSTNELRTLKTLSSYYDVYYNNDLYSPDRSELGVHDVLGPNREYDYYYIRNNPNVFFSINGRRISFAYPYDERIFAESHALLVLTDNWKEHLKRERPNSGAKLAAIYNGIQPAVSCPVINVGQALDPALASARPTKQELFNLKARTSGAWVFGYYGNLSPHLYPYVGFSALERLSRDVPATSIVIALAGKFRAGGEIRGANLLHVGSLPYAAMPALHDNTLANLTNESPLNDCLGNQKVIDSISRGVPVMCRRHDTFVSQLGADYPCLYETEDEAYRIARQLIYDVEFRQHVRDFSLQRSEYFAPDRVAARFLAQAELTCLA